MQLAVFNGSPRYKKSNSKILIDHFLKGFYNDADLEYPVHYLANTKNNSNHIKAFKEATSVIIIFPLYTDAMPGQVKFFFESLDDINTHGKKIGFIVQSGFPEAYHSTFIERYLEKLSKSSGWNYSGTVIKGGVEGIQAMPANMTKKLFSQFFKLGEHYAHKGEFNEKIMAELRKPYQLRKGRLFMVKLMQITGIMDYYWKKKLKENNAWNKRFDTPYQ